MRLAVLDMQLCVVIAAQDDGQAQPFWHSAAGVSCFFCACPTDKAA